MPLKPRRRKNWNIEIYQQVEDIDFITEGLVVGTKL